MGFGIPTTVGGGQAECGRQEDERRIREPPNDGCAQSEAWGFQTSRDNGMDTTNDLSSLPICHLSQ